MLAFRLARLRAGRLDCRVDHFRVTLRGNFLLSNGDHITDGAVLALSLAGFGASRLNSRINDLGMALGRNLFLCNENFFADGAVLALGLAGFGAGRLDSRINDFGVAGRRNLSLCNENFIANRAVLTFGQSSLRAGRSLCCVNDFGVPLGGSLSLCNENFIANRAVLTFGQSSLRAGRSLCCVNDFGVPLGGNLSLCNENFIANRAVLAFGQTSLRAGWGLCCIDYFGVAGRGDLFHTGENRITNGALRTGRMTSLGAGSGLFRNFNRSMSSCIDCFGLGCIANCAGVGLDAGILTGRRGRNHAFVPAVALCRNGFTRLLYFITNLAIGIADVAFLSAGRLTAITNLGQRVVILPAGFEGQVGEGIEPCFSPLFIFDLIRVIENVAHGSGDEPTGEVIASTSKAAFGKRIARIGDDLHRGHRAVAAVGVKGDGQLFKLVELRLIVCVLMNIYGRIAIVRNPTLKLVSIIVVLRTLRKIPFVGHCVLDGVVALLQDFVVPVQPADMILVQRPLGVEGDIFAGGDVCLVGIGRSATVSSRVPTGEVIVRAGEGVGGQGSRLIGLHGLGTHGALAAVGIKGDDRVLGPLGIQGGIRAEIHGLPVGIGRAGTVCLGIPAGEGVAFAGKGVIWQIKTRIGHTCPGRHRSFAAVGVKVNSDVRSTAPYAIQIGNGRTRTGICRLGVGAVGVVQLGGSNIYTNIFLRILVELIGFITCTGCANLSILTSSFTGSDIGTRCRRVNSALNCQHAVYIDLSISNPSGPLSRR